METTRSQEAPPAVNTKTVNMDPPISAKFRIADSEDLTVKVNTMKRTIEHEMQVAQKIQKHHLTNPELITPLERHIEKRVQILQKQPAIMALEISTAVQKASLQQPSDNAASVNSLKTTQKLEQITG